MEEYCLMDYKTYTGKIPTWNLQEQGLDWPDIVKMQYANLLQESTKRPGRNKKKTNE